MSKEKKSRKFGMMTCSGVQGVGKTYENMHIIRDYIKDKFETKVRGRKCLILDTNGEYTEQQFSDNDIPNFPVKLIALRDVVEWSRSELSEARRLDMRNLSIPKKKAVIEYVITNLRHGMVVLEDINTYIQKITHMEEIVSGLVNLRHRGVDVLISFQSLRPVEPRIWQNSRWVRMHYQADNVNDIKGKLTDPTLFKIAQLIVNNRFFSGIPEDKHFFLIIHNFDKKIQGNFTIEEFREACSQFLLAHKKYAKEYRDMNNCKNWDEAVIGQTGLYEVQYYGNVK